MAKENKHTIETKIKDFDFGSDKTDFFGKFLVHQESENIFGVYAYKYPMYHKEITEKYALSEDRVLGGGKYAFSNGNFELSDRSEDYESIPDEFAEVICGRMRNYLIEQGVDVKSTSVDMDIIDEEDKNFEKWRALGFI